MTHQTMARRGAGKVTINGNTRTTGLEQYYTPPELAARLLKVAQSIIPNWSELIWIDPCAGTGSFTSFAKSSGVAKVFAYDIDPKSDDIKELNFLESELSFPGAVCVTNPPFGRNNSLSVPFFNKLAMGGCDYIGFIIPKSWRKWTVQNRLDTNFHLIYDEDLIVDYVDENGIHVSEQKGGLKTVFQIWERRFTPRPKVVVEDRGYITKVAPAEADVSLTIFGRGCGTVRTDFDRTKKNTTQMYLAISDPSVKTALERANLAQYFNNVAFVEALSIVEIRAALNEWYDKQNEQLP